MPAPGLKLPTPYRSRSPGTLEQGASSTLTVVRTEKVLRRRYLDRRIVMERRLQDESRLILGIISTTSFVVVIIKKAFNRQSLAMATAGFLGMTMLQEGQWLVNVVLHALYITCTPVALLWLSSMPLLSYFTTAYSTGTLVYEVPWLLAPAMLPEPAVTLTIIIGWGS